MGSPAANGDAHDRADELLDGVGPIRLPDEAARSPAAVGQICQPMSLAPINWPLPRSDLATSTSTVSSGGGGGALAAPALAALPLASKAATPPAARATPSTMRRAAFITLHFPHDADGAERPSWPDLTS